MGATGGASGVCVVALALSTFLMSVHGQNDRVQLPLRLLRNSCSQFSNCDGVEVVYVMEKAREIYRKAPSAAKEAHMFVAQVTLTNLGYSSFETWGVGLSYSHQEVGINLTKIAKRFGLLGVEFGETLFPMPVTLNITNPRYKCSAPQIYGNSTMRWAHRRYHADR